MKRSIIAIAIMGAACQMQAQSYHVCNSNGTMLEIPAKENREITFDAEQRLVKFHNTGNVTHSFATAHVKSVETVKPTTGTPLSYTTELDVTFNANDADSYDEIVETIITDDVIDESGDFVENYAPEKRVTITFSETGISIVPKSVSGINFDIKNNHLVVNSTTGKVQYIVKGSCSNGSVKFYSTKKFQLMLGGLDLTNPTGPAINIQTGKTIYFTIGAGTENSLCDGATYNAPTVSGGKEESQKGTLFSEGQLIFNGTGKLNVTSLGGHAICSDDYIRIRSGKINILSSAKDGFHTNDQFRVGRMEKYAPEINVTATGDAIDCGKGNVIVEAGKLILKSDGEAIKVSNEDSIPTISASATIKGGYIKIITTGAKSSGIKTTDNYTQSGGVVECEVLGDGSKVVNCDGNFSFTGGKLTGFAEGTIHESDTTSAGGIKSQGDMKITGGTIAIKCTGEGAKGINCDGSVTVEGGTTAVISQASNYNSTADDKKSRAVSCITLTQNGGTLLLSAYDKAVSAAAITIADGTLHAISTNDTEAISIDATQTGGWLMTKGEE